MPILERLEDYLRVNHHVNLLRTNPRVHPTKDVSASSANEHFSSLPGLEKRGGYSQACTVGAGVPSFAVWRSVAALSCTTRPDGVGCRGALLRG